MKQVHEGLDYRLYKMYVCAGPEGVGVQRHAKGTNMWLYDLWLAEYLADRVGAGG